MFQELVLVEKPARHREIPVRAIQYVAVCTRLLKVRLHHGLSGAHHVGWGGSEFLHGRVDMHHPRSTLWETGS